MTKYHVTKCAEIQRHTEELTADSALTARSPNVQSTNRDSTGRGSVLEGQPSYEITPKEIGETLR